MESGPKSSFANHIGLLDANLLYNSGAMVQSRTFVMLSLISSVITRSPTCGARADMILKMFICNETSQDIKEDHGALLLSWIPLSSVIFKFASSLL